VWSASRPGRLYPRERPSTHCTGGWVGPGVGLDRCGKSRPTGLRSPDLPARGKSLYRLRHPGSLISIESIPNLLPNFYVYFTRKSLFQCELLKLNRFSRSAEKLPDSSTNLSSGSFFEVLYISVLDIRSYSRIWTLS
jgi:hypothetical protein